MLGVSGLYADIPELVRAGAGAGATLVRAPGAVA
jgi:hypothetical protein